MAGWLQEPVSFSLGYRRWISGSPLFTAHILQVHPNIKPSSSKPYHLLRQAGVSTWVTARTANSLVGSSRMLQRTPPESKMVEWPEKFKSTQLQNPVQWRWPLRLTLTMVINRSLQVLLHHNRPVLLHTEPAKKSLLSNRSPVVLLEPLHGVQVMQWDVPEQP